MKTLEVKQDNAIKAYNGADAKAKQLLSDLFGPENLNIKITDRVKTYADACEVLGVDPDGSIIVETTGCFSNDAKSILAYGKLILIARALNEGWTPDWNDISQYKYYPWLEYKSGVGFSCSGCDVTRADADVGSRLCFKSRELAEYAAEQFNQIYNDFFSL